MKRMKHTFIQFVTQHRFGALCVLPVLWIIETSLLILTNCLPDRFVKAHISSGLQQISEEGMYPSPFYLTQSTLDNFTDSIILQESQRTSEWNNVIDKLTTKDVYAIDSPLSAHNPLYAAFTNQGYARYWHGYTVLTKPLLMVFDYSEIRMISLFAITLLVALSFFAVRKEFGIFVAASLIIGYIAMGVPIAHMSLQYTPVTYTVLLSMTFARLFEERKRRLLLFMTLGSVINYWDFLTYPLLTLGFPLIFCVLYDLRHQRRLISILGNIVLLSGAWAVAYVSTWAVKWTLSTIVLRRNVLMDAYNNVVRRSGSEVSGKVYSKWDTISLNVRTALQSPMWMLYAVFFVGFILALVVLYAKTREDVTGCHSGLQGLIPCMLIGVYPILWWTVIQNHSQEHATLFVFKDFSLTIFAGSVFLILFVEWVFGVLHRLWVK